MAIVQVKDAEGSVLDWMVGIAQSIPNLHVVKKQRWNCVYGMVLVEEGNFIDFPYKPSADWSQGGPIKEHEGINDFRYNKIDPNEPDRWCAHKVVPRPNMEGSTNMVAIALDGPTPIIAAMRCYVASKLGDEVDIPEELLP